MLVVVQVQVLEQDPHKSHPDNVVELVFFVKRSQFHQFDICGGICVRVRVICGRLPRGCRYLCLYWNLVKLYARHHIRVDLRSYSSIVVRAHRDNESVGEYARDDK